MPKSNILPLDCALYLADTTELTTEESGAYLHLLMQAWLRHCKLPADDERLARLSRVNPRRWGRIKANVLAFFEPCEDGQLVNKKLLQVYNEQNRLKIDNGGTLGKTPNIKTPKVCSTYGGNGSPKRGFDIGVESPENCESGTLARASRPRARATPPNNTKIDRGTQIDPEFKPDGTFEQQAVLKGWTPQYVQQCLEEFIAHHEQKGTYNQNWSAAFRLWCLRQQRYDLPRSQQSKAPAHGNGSSAEYFLKRGRRLKEQHQH